MSLLDSAMEPMVLYEKTRIPDGEGGTIVTWREGAEFLAAVTFDASMQARIGEVQGVSSRYTVTTRKNMILSYHDIFRRLSDGKIFRVTSDGDDKATPMGAGLNMRQVQAEEWSIPA